MDQGRKSSKPNRLSTHIFLLGGDEKAGDFRHHYYKTVMVKWDEAAGVLRVLKKDRYMCEFTSFVDEGDQDAMMKKEYRPNADLLDSDGPNS